MLKQQATLLPVASTMLLVWTGPNRAARCLRQFYDLRSATAVSVLIGDGGDEVKTTAVTISVFLLFFRIFLSFLHCVLKHPIYGLL